MSEQANRATNWSAAVAVSLLVGAGSLLSVSPPARPVALPLLVVMGLVLLTVLVLRERDSRLPVLDLGCLCALITGLYAAIPLLGFWLGGLQWSPQSDFRLSAHPPSMAQVTGVAWRSVTYLASFVAAYLVLRGRLALPTPDPRQFDRPAAFAVVGAILGFTAFFLYVSVAYGASENPSYVSLRTGTTVPWTELPTLVRFTGRAGGATLLVAKVCALVILLRQWRSVRHRAVLIAWLALETAVSVLRMGSRRDAAMLLIAAVLLYHHLVKPLVLWQAAAAVVLLGGALAYGFVREEQQPSWTAANEFQVLFSNACDLLARRPGLEVPWQVRLDEVLRLVPRLGQDLLGVQSVDPSKWYLAVLGVRDPTAGLMFGVVPQAIVGWDWPELVARGALLGLTFAGIHRWCVRSNSVWALVFYVYVCLWSYYTFRATTFYFVSLIVYRFVPASLLLLAAGTALGRLLPSAPAAARPPTSA
jgi:hypothetical protein